MHIKVVKSTGLNPRCLVLPARKKGYRWNPLRWLPEAVADVEMTPDTDPGEPKWFPEEVLTISRAKTNLQPIVRVGRVSRA